MRLPGGEGGEGEAQRELKISICDSSSSSASYSTVAELWYDSTRLDSTLNDGHTADAAGRAGGMMMRCAEMAQTALALCVLYVRTHFDQSASQVAWHGVSTV